MKTYQKVTLWSAAGILILSLGAWAFFETTFSGWGLCVNTIYQTEVSPDKTHRAVIFQRNCGATTGFSTQVSILGHDDALPEGKGNTYIAAGHPQITKLQLNWLDEMHLSIRNTDSAAFKSETRIGSIQVSYK